MQGPKEYSGIKKNTISKKSQNKRVRPQRLPVPGFVPDEIIYVDGACKGNNQPDESLRRAGYGVWFGDDDPRNFYGRLPGIQANGGAELYAIYKVLKMYAGSEKSIEVRTDSTYARDTINNWMHGWAKKGWVLSSRKPIKNLEIVKKLFALHSTMSNRFTLTWVKAHSGIHGNEMADQLANRGCAMELDGFTRKQSFLKRVNSCTNAEEPLL